MARTKMRHQVTAADIGKTVGVWDDGDYGTPEPGELMAIYKGRFIVCHDEEEILAWDNAKLGCEPHDDCCANGAAIKELELNVRAILRVLLGSGVHGGELVKAIDEARKEAGNECR